MMCDGVTLKNFWLSLRASAVFIAGCALIAEALRREIFLQNFKNRIARKQKDKRQYNILIGK